MWRTTVHTCANGLKALTLPRRETPVVAVHVWVETGSMLEGQYAGSGISHLLEHMVFKGTQEYSAARLNEEVSALGGLWNAYTGTDRTVFHIDGPSAHWREFLHILLQLTLHPTFPEDEWAPERDVIRREMDMYGDDANDATYRALIETLFRKHPRRLPVIGERAAFDALTPEDMRRYHAERYVPGNMFICVVGDVDPAEVAQAVEEEAGSLPARGVPPACLPAEPRQWGPRLCRREFPKPTSSLMLAWRIPELNHPDVAALSLLSCILGDGRTAWLYKTFHEDRALAHDISTMVIPHTPDEGALVIEADVDRAGRDALRDALLAWVAELPSMDFAPALARTLRQLKVRHLRAQSTVQGLAETLGSFWHHSRNTAAYEEWRSALERVTPADLQRVARTWLSPERLTEVSVDPPGSNPAPEAASADGAKSAPRVSALPGGLRCITRVDKRLPMAYATLAVGGGCRVETAETAGICALLAECLPKGTTTRSGETLAAQVEDMGGSLHCHAGNNTILLTLRCLAEDVPAMLELLADVALHPTFPQEAVQTAREDMLADIMEDEEEPVALAFRRLRELCFGRVSYGNSPGGTQESVAALTREDLLRLHARLLHGANVTLSLAGDVDADQVEALAAQYFADLPAGQGVEYAATPAQHAGDLQVAGPKGKEQAVLAMALPGLPASHPDLPKLLLLDEWCQDMAGPVYSEIREKRGLAYHASSALLQGTDAGCLYFSLETAPELLPQARAALEDLLARLAAEGMPPEALERARSTALSARLLAAQSLSKLSSGTAVDTLLGLGADHMEQVIAAISAVQHAEMQAFIRRLFAPEGVRSCVCVLPPTH